MRAGWASRVGDLHFIDESSEAQRGNCSCPFLASFSPSEDKDVDRTFRGSDFSSGHGEEEALAFKAASGRNVTWGRAAPGARKCRQHAACPETWLSSWEVVSLLVPPRKDPQPNPQTAPGCVLWPCPSVGLRGSPWPRPCFAGPFLQPGLPACVLASFPSRLLVNPPGAQLTPWHAPESLAWLSASP